MFSYYFQCLSTSMGSTVKSQGTETVSASFFFFCKASKIEMHKNESYNKYFPRKLLRALKKCLTIHINTVFFWVQTKFIYTSGSKNLPTLNKTESLKGKLELRQLQTLKHRRSERDILSQPLRSSHRLQERQNLDFKSKERNGKLALLSTRVGTKIQRLPGYSRIWLLHNQSIQTSESIVLKTQIDETYFSGN